MIKNFLKIKEKYLKHLPIQMKLIQIFSVFIGQEVAQNKYSIRFIAFFIVDKILFILFTPFKRTTACLKEFD